MRDARPPLPTLRTTDVSTTLQSLLRRTTAFHYTSAALVVLSLSLILGFQPLYGASLTWEAARHGKLSGFSVYGYDNPSTPSGYENDNSYVSKTNSVGRLLYQGEPTTFTFSNDGHIISGGETGRFYWTHIRNAAEWRRIFFVIRVKGQYHNGTTTVDISPNNVPIEFNDTSYTITDGAGSETVSSKEMGYNAVGAYGSNAEGAFPYKYRFRYIWIDLMVIKTPDSTWWRFLGLENPQTGYYETYLTVTSQSGSCVFLDLSAENAPTLFHAQPDLIATFELDKVYTCPILYDDLPQLNYAYDTIPSPPLEIASLRYASTEHKAKITIASNATGTSQEFYFKRNGSNDTFPFRLAFKATTPAISISEITSANKSFNSTDNKQKYVSPIDAKEYHAYEMRATLHIFLSNPTEPPMPGVYRSDIYIFVEKR